MTTAVKRQKLQSFIETVDDKKVKALYMMFEEEIEYDHWKDKEFIAEMEKRSADFKAGKTETKSWEEVKSRLLAKLK